jgi:hypothetical protein
MIDYVRPTDEFFEMEAKNIWELAIKPETDEHFPQELKGQSFYQKVRFWVNHFYGERSNTDSLYLHVEYLWRRALEIGIDSGHHQERKATRADGMPWNGESGLIYYPQEHLPIELAPNLDAVDLETAARYAKKLVNPNYFGSVAMRKAGEQSEA